jgi:hypothetical protein
VTHEPPGDLQTEAACFQQPGGCLTQHEVCYEADLLHAEAAEDYYLVQPVQELRPEVGLQSETWILEAHYRDVTLLCEL